MTRPHCAGRQRDRRQCVTHLLEFGRLDLGHAGRVGRLLDEGQLAVGRAGEGRPPFRTPLAAVCLVKSCYAFAGLLGAAHNPLDAPHSAPCPVQYPPPSSPLPISKLVGAAQACSTRHSRTYASFSFST